MKILINISLISAALAAEAPITINVEVGEDKDYTIKTGDVVSFVGI